jgi:hypothetical protein
MKTSLTRSRAAISAIGIAAGTVLCACHTMSEFMSDGSAGKNGGFEIVKSGLPVNWRVYTPKTLPSGDYDLIIDATEHQAGKQSLKFVVRECSPEGGWHSPGFSGEYDATPGAKYRIGFWVKNDGAEFLARIGGLTATESRYETIVRSRETIAAWKHYQYEYTIPQDFKRIRFELNIVQPGTFWIDEVTIEPHHTALGVVGLLEVR